MNEYLNRIGTGFLCTNPLDDVLVGGRITRLVDRLQDAIQLHRGAPFPIARPSKDISGDARLETMMNKALSEPCLLFPIVTPGLFKNETCCREVLAFGTLKSKFGRARFIFPIYFVGADLMESNSAREQASSRIRNVVDLVQLQYEDWRELRLDNEAAETYANAIDQFAQRVASALSRLPFEPEQVSTD